MSLAQYLLQRCAHALLRARGYPIPVAEVAVVLLDGLLVRDVAGGAFAVAHDHDERIRADLLGHELILDVRLGRQEDELGFAEVEGRYVDGGAGVGTLTPAQTQGAEALTERPLVAGDTFRQVLDGETGTIARFEA